MNLQDPGEEIILQPSSRYKPGKHIIIEATNCDQNSLTDLKGFHQLMTQQFESMNLNVLGEVLHQFESGGYTAVYCLTESHVAVHTWPEHSLVTFDIFLSNYQQINDHKGEALEVEMMAFFRSSTFNRNVLSR